MFFFVVRRTWASTFSLVGVDTFGQLTNAHFVGAEKVSFAFSFFSIAYQIPTPTVQAV